MGTDSAEQAIAMAAELVYPALMPVAALEQEFVLARGETGVMALRVNNRKSATYEGEQNRQGIRVGELGLMINFDDSSELTDIPQIYHLPNTPHWLLGVVNLHGRLIPVFDLLRFLHLDSSPDQSTQRLLILGHDADAAGILIDNLPYRLKWTNEKQSDADLAPQLLEPHVRACCMIEEQIWFDLDSDSLLNALERTLEAN